MTVEALLDSGAIRLVISFKFARKYRFKLKGLYYYELRSLGLDNRTTLVLSNTRELDRELFYKLVYLI